MSSLRLPTTLAVIFGSFTLGFYVAIQGPTLMDLIDLLHINNDIMSYSLAFASLAYSVGGLLSGFLFNYVNRQLLIAGYFIVFGLSNIVTPFITNYMVFSVITAFKMMCAGGTDCGANVWILEMWPGKDAWLQALHFMFAVGCALGPLVVEPFLSVEYKDTELEKLAGKTSGTTTINDQNNESRIHIPYGLSGLCSIVAALVILYLYYLENKRKKAALKLRAKQQLAAGEHILLTSTQHPALLEAGGVCASIEEEREVELEEELALQQHQELNADCQQPASKGNALTESAVFLPASPTSKQEASPPAGGGDEAPVVQQQQQQQSVGADQKAAQLQEQDPQEAPKSASSLEQQPPVAGPTHQVVATAALKPAPPPPPPPPQPASPQATPTGAIADSPKQAPKPAGPPTPTSSPAPTGSPSPDSLPNMPQVAPQCNAQQQQQQQQQQPNAQLTKITSKAREQEVGRPPYYVMVAIALSAMCLSFYCGIEITSMNYLATFATNIELQLSKSTAALMSSALTISFAVGRGVGIWLANSMKPHKLFYLCAFVMALGNVFMLIFANTAETLLWWSICLFGVGCGPMFPAIVSFYDDKISKVTNTVSGIFILGSMFNVALNSLIIGHHIIDNALILIVCNLVGSVLLLLLFGTLHMLTKVKRNQRVKKFNRQKRLQTQQELQPLQSTTEAPLVEPKASSAQDAHI